MPEICFARQTCKPADLIGDDPQRLSDFLDQNGLGTHDLLVASKAYSLSCADSQDRCIVRKLNALPTSQRQCLARAADAMGDETHVFAAFTERYLSPENLNRLNGLVGAGATAAYARLGDFEQALVNYQKALNELRAQQSHRGRGAGHGRRQAQLKVRHTYLQLQQAYGRELSLLSAEHLRHKNRGNALSNADRGITLAERRPNAKPDPKLNVANTPEANRLTRTASFINGAGRVAIGLDAGLRVHQVHSVHQEGGEWMREASAQLTGFAANAGFGLGAGKVTIGVGTSIKAGLGLAGPAGWVALGVVVGAGVVSGFVVGKEADSRLQSLVRKLWDRE